MVCSDLTFTQLAGQTWIYRKTLCSSSLWPCNPLPVVVTGKGELIAKCWFLSWRHAAIITEIHSGRTFLSDKEHRWSKCLPSWPVRDFLFYFPLPSLDSWVVLWIQETHCGNQCKPLWAGESGHMISTGRRAECGRVIGVLVEWLAMLVCVSVSILFIHARFLLLIDEIYKLSVFKFRGPFYKGGTF